MPEAWRAELQQALPPDWAASLTDLRVARPEAAEREASRRQRRERLAPDGRLVILACDHPARMVTKVGSDPLAMGDRLEYLARIARILLASPVDGVMATPDVLDDLFFLSHLLRERGRQPLLDGKVVLGCLNRGGLAGAAWELDDFLTGHTPEAAAAWRLDGLKMMFRLHPEEPGAARTIAACADAITRLSRLGLPSFLEPLPVVRSGTGWSIDMRPEALIPVIGVAQALGESSARTWLKLPIVPDYGRVARATTMPILVLGGEATGDPSGVLHSLAGAMAAGPNVRGALIGRNVIFPGAADPAAVAGELCTVVRGTASSEV
jgi:DhnA family fructose-bisphosphate aldolase class Ia